MNKSEKAEYLTNKGYHEYKPTKFHSDGIEKCFQKRFSDKKGTRYFIDVNQWEDMTHPKTGEQIDGGYEYEVYFYDNTDKHLPIRMLFYAGWNVDDVEKYAEKMFDSGIYGYYELNELI